MWKPFKGKSHTTTAGPVARKSSPWHSVSIISAGPCCEGSRRLWDSRFLSREAPRLPLADCTMGGDCHCQFQHHEDRRGQPRRAQERGFFQSEGFAGAERRRMRGRRSTDVHGIKDWNG